MYWKYLIKVLGCSRFNEIRVDSWQEMLEELEELKTEHCTVEGVYDSAGHRVPV